MATIMVGSARHDEDNNYTGGSAGDQLQESSTNDTKGEVSMQTMYTHSKGWYILRPPVAYADKIAERMKAACNNAKIGYDQNNRLGIITYGIDTTTKTECDCSSLVRQVVKEATGTDPGNFTTANEATKLTAIGFTKSTYTSQSATPVYNGDVLVTKSKGHTVVVVSGNPRTDSSSSSSSSSSSKSSSVDTAKYYQKSLAGTYKTTSALNLRTGAGTSKSILCVIPKGASVKNYGYYNLNGSTKWLYVTYGNYTGYCSVSYLKKS